MKLQSSGEGKKEREMGDWVGKNGEVDGRKRKKLRGIGKRRKK